MTTLINSSDKELYHSEGEEQFAVYCPTCGGSGVDDPNFDGWDDEGDSYAAQKQLEPAKAYYERALLKELEEKDRQRIQSKLQILALPPLSRV